MENILIIVLLLALIGVQIWMMSRTKNQGDIGTQVANDNARNRDTLLNQIKLSEQGQQQQLNAFNERMVSLTETQQKKFDEMRNAMEQRLKSLNDDNVKQLDQMRGVVDQKLKATLESSFKNTFDVVAQGLKSVNESVGEMRKLAGDVGSLKKVLSNVKSRGVWGEYMLGNILSEYLSADQYVQNYSPRKNSDFVEFAIKFPGKIVNGNPVYLPIDSKFPREDYERLLTACELADADAEKNAQKALLSAITKCAKDINSKYVTPPETTPFALMFLPTEGLYAEVIRAPGFMATLHELNVLPVGPTNLAAVLSSLSVGFATIAIEKKSSEISSVLVKVNQEFKKFDDALKKSLDYMDKSQKNMESMQKISQRLQRKLIDFQSESPEIISENLTSEDE